MKYFLSAVALVLAATNARAQVGHLPDNSPYRDLETSQELTFFGGRYRAGPDPIGIAPRGGPMFGLRYEIHVGGPALLMARCSCRVDLDPYTFGTPFAFSFGGGLRYVPGGRFQLRADLNDYLYQLKYPTAYYVTPTNGTAAVTGNQARSFWKNNRAFTLGASLLFFR